MGLLLVTLTHRKRAASFWFLTKYPWTGNEPLVSDRADDMDRQRILGELVKHNSSRNMIAFGPSGHHRPLAIVNVEWLTRVPQVPDFLV